MNIFPFNNEQLQQIDSFVELEAKLNFRNLLGFEVVNLTPAFWQVIDENGLVQKIIAPWQVVHSNFSQYSQYFIIKTDYDLPLFHIPVDPPKRKLAVTFFENEITPFDTELSISNVINNIITKQGNQIQTNTNLVLYHDSNSGAKPATTVDTVLILDRPSRNIEFWNRDTTNDIWFNFGDEITTQGGTDYHLKPGEYWTGSVQTTKIHYQGGQLEVQIWG